MKPHTPITGNLAISIGHDLIQSGDTILVFP